MRIVSVEPRDNAGRNSSIPRLIVQTFADSDVPERMYKASRSWPDRNPDHRYVFCDDDACRAFIDAHFDADVVKCYDSLPAGAFRADFWRYCVLLTHGGVYADIDTTCRMPISKLLRPDDEFVIAHGTSKEVLFNAFICSIPGHPFLRAVIERAKEHILCRTFQRLHAEDPWISLHIVGPRGLAAAVNASLGRPETAQFEVGRHTIAGISFRVLRKIHGPHRLFRRVMDGFRTVIICKYRGYVDDLRAAGHSHWRD